MSQQKDRQNDLDQFRLKEYDKAADRKLRNKDRWVLVLGTSLITFALSSLSAIIAFLREHIK